MRDRRTCDTGLSRRHYLTAVGAASIASTLVDSASAADEDNYDRVVDIVEAGADNSGEEPIDEVFAEEARDDTLLKFPEGTYVANDLIIYQLENFAMVGDDATLVPGENYNEDVWLGGAEVRDVRIENFTIDNTEAGVAPQVDISAYGSLVVRNVHKAGFHDGHGIAFAFQMLTEDGDGLLENVVAPDGGNTVGIYLNSEGPMTVRDCRVEGFTNNGLYASNCTSPVVVEGGRFRNNNISQVRLGCADSIIRNARLEVDEPVSGPQADVVNMRGVRIADGSGPVTIENCRIELSNTQGSGGICGAYDGGSFHVRDTDIHVEPSYTTTGSDGSRTSHAILVTEANGVDPGRRTIDGLTVTGGGQYRSAVVFHRDNNELRNLCIEQDGDGRNGVVFVDSHDNELRDSIVSVTGDPVVTRDGSVTTEDVATEGSCQTSGDGTGAATETGSMVRDQAGPDDWTGVGLAATYDHPVAVAGPLSTNGTNPCHARLREVTDHAFDLQFEEWRYTESGHEEEHVSYHVAERGVHDYGGLTVEVDDVWTDHRFTSVAFDADFGATPVVLAIPQTVMGSDPIVTRIGDVSAGSASLRVQEVEGSAYGGYHNDERVGYAAFEPGTGSINGDAIEVGTAAVDEKWTTVSFDRSYDQPRFLADIQTYNGPNTANLRYRNLGSDGVEVFVEEDQSHDQETLHRYERVGYVVVEGA